MLLSDLVDRNAQTNARGLATCFHGRTRTWEQFADRCARLAHGLRELAVRPGDRVAILANNADRFSEFFFAVARAGAVFVPINSRLALPEIAYWLEDSGSEVLFIDDYFLPMLARIMEVSRIRHVIYIGEEASPPEGLLSQERLIAEHAPDDATERRAEDLVGIFYTGGTTGRSKGVMLNHRNLITSAYNLVPAISFEESVRYLHAAPMFHLADGAATFALAMVGGSNFYLPRFDPMSMLKMIAESHITHCVLIPTMLNLVVNHSEAKEFDLSSLRQLAYGGAPMPEAVVRKTIEMLPAVRLTQAYGQTEASPVLTVNTHEQHALSGPHARRLRSAGRAVCGVRLGVLDPAGREVERGQVGEICARGDVVMMGYWNKPEQTVEALRGGWLHTGDMGTMDEDGFVYVVDRLKDMIITGGENVYSAEVEQAVYQHPAILECAVIGAPDDKWGERVHAIVRLKPGHELDAAQLINHCRELIAGYKCPDTIEIRAEAFPLSGAGKVLKSVLREPFWQGRTQNIN